MHLTPRRGGFLVIHPQYQATLASQRYRRPEDILDLPGEVISGHPDRHVMQVQVESNDGSKCTAYLKRQHFVTWKERLRNAFAGFGRVSKSVREAILLSSSSCSACWLNGLAVATRTDLLMRSTGNTHQRRQTAAGKLRASSMSTS